MRMNMLLTMLLCLSAVTVLPLRAQRWVSEVQTDPQIQYQQYVGMDGGDAVLAVGSSFRVPEALPDVDVIGGLLKVRSDGSWDYREVRLPGKRLFLCTATALDDGNCMVFGFLNQTGDSLDAINYRDLHVMVVDSLLRTVSEREYHITPDEFSLPSDSYVNNMMRCVKASDGNVVLSVSLVHELPSKGHNRLFRFYEFTPSGDTVASRTQPEYIDGLLQSGYSVQALFPKEGSDGFVFLGRGAFLPKSNYAFGVWNLDRDMNITNKRGLYFGSPFFLSPNDMGSDGHWYGGGRFMAYLEKWTSYDEPDPEGWLFMLDTLAGRHGSLMLPPTDSLSIARYSYGCNTAYVNDSTVLAVSYTQSQGVYRQVNVTLVDSGLDVLGRKALVDEGWNSQPQTPVALNDGGVVIPVNQYNDSEERLKLVCLSRDDIQVTWNAASETAARADAYPNPAADRISIPLPGVLAGDARLRITDARGGVCADGPVRQAGGLLSVNVSNLAPGAYTYRITASGSVIASGKFVKQ